MKMIVAGPNILRVKWGEKRPGTQCASRTMDHSVRKMATPPIRGVGRVWMCRSELGAEHHPRCTAKSRTHRVRTADIRSALANVRMCIISLFFAFFEGDEMPTARLAFD